MTKNGLRQVDVAKYLGITESSISSAVKGRNNLSEANLTKLLSNTEGWDVSMFAEEGIFNSGNINNGHDQNIGTNATLISVIQMQQEQMGELIKTITTLTNKLK